MLQLPPLKPGARSDRLLELRPKQLRILIQVTEFESGRMSHTNPRLRNKNEIKKQSPLLYDNLLPNALRYPAQHLAAEKYLLVVPDNYLDFLRLFSLLRLFRGSCMVRDST